MATRKLSDIHAAIMVNKKPERIDRRDFLDHMTFQRNIGPVFTEYFGPIIGLKEEWAAQGATPEELDFSCFRYRYPTFTDVAVNTGFLADRPEEILEENDDHIIARDPMGRTVKLSKAASTLALPLNWPVKNMDDWQAFKHHYAFSEERFAADWEQKARAAFDAGDVVTVSIPGGYDQPRQLMGDELACMAYYEQPELMHDILTTIGETAFKVLDRVTQAVQVDVLFVHEDMAGKSGPLAGPKQIDEFIGPYYRRVWDMLRDRGVKLLDQDSDGDMNPVLSNFIEAGMNCSHPAEPAANMDIVKIREKYGTKLALIGGLDKHVVRRSPDEIVAELEYKIPPMIASGGCALSLDHRIPNGTPLENYRFYIKKAWEIMEREAARLS